MTPTEIPSRKSWKQDLAPYLAIDERRSLGQIASVLIPYVAIWMIAALIEPSAPVAIALGLIATVFLTRMYSLFHDLTHNSMFESREANSRWGHSSATCSSRRTAGVSERVPRRSSRIE